MLVTRPRPGLDETVAELDRRGWFAIAAPMLECRTIRLRSNASGSPRTQAVLLTSGQALPALDGLDRVRTRIMAVGDATAARAKRDGFERVESAGGDAGSLRALVRDRLRPGDGPLLLACGRGHGLALARELRCDGFRVRRCCVYRTEPLGEIAPAAREALAAGAVGAVLFFSADAVRAFAAALPSDLEPALRTVWALAISERCARPLRAGGWERVSVASAPNADALLERLEPDRDRSG